MVCELKKVNIGQVCFLNIFKHKERRWKRTSHADTRGPKSKIVKYPALHKQLVSPAEVEPGKYKPVNKDGERNLEVKR